MSPDANTAGAWSKKLAPYREPRTGRSILEIVVTAVPLLALWTAAWFLYARGLWWAALLLAVPSSLFLVRLFMIQHDCGHQAFFGDRKANDWVGRIIGVFTLTPYDYWRQTHAIHHATSGNLDRRGLGAIEMLTVEEYRALSPLRRLGYRLYRHPVVMFGLGPAFVFFLMNRVPIGMMRQGWRPWVSVLGNTLALVVATGVLIWVFGPAPVLIVNAMTMLLAATIGVWLFYIQHQFEGASWSRNGVWKRDEAALAGSSHYDLPPVLRWFTANIGIHHVHHLSSRIPYYRLPKVLQDFPELRPMSRVGLMESFRCARLALWDEAKGRLVSFREVRA
ncbi:fatty acid desaturase [Phenylobacterium sp.]|uniref:fatty acid desaturase n=1 Tax=Phenylobacterium sp. TaxID=1871053 RepID=UPI002CA606DF|nr:fatty acid desaturase [Phenylobacterium sp.]HVI33788.1 fatty acid desaturase [Phenylobacterium sp.]